MAVHLRDNHLDVRGEIENTSRNNSRRQPVFSPPYYPVNATSAESLREKKSPLQKKWLKDRLKRTFLFSGLEPRWLDEVVDAMASRPVAAGDYVFKQGEVSDTLYIIGKGVFHEYADEKYVGCHESGSWGEVALLHDTLLTSSLVAGGQGTVWSLQRAPYRLAAANSAHHRRQLNKRLLSSVPNLAHLPDHILSNLADSLIQVEAEDGRAIVREGRPATGMHLVEEGRVSLRLEDQGLESRVLQEGEYFGESSLWGGESQVTHTAYALGRVKLLLLRPEAYARLVGPGQPQCGQRKPQPKKSKF